jgi:NifU-like protein
LNDEPALIIQLPCIEERWDRVNSLANEPAKTLAGDELFASVRKLIDTDIRPYVQADGGDIELVGIEGNRVKVRLTGACEFCPSSPSTLREGVEARLKVKIAPGLVVEEIK